jgi:hypothetical protein
MAARKTLAQLKKQYESAKAREAYLVAHPPVRKTTVDRRPRTNLAYASYMQKETNVVGTISTTSSQIFSLPASDAAVAFFGGATKLGLKSLASITVKPVAAPDFWIPAKVHAMVGTDTPAARTTGWGTRVVRTYRPTAGEAQGFYQAPISAGVDNSTFELLEAKAQALYASVKTSLGAGNAADYARFYLTPENFNIQFS